MSWGDIRPLTRSHAFSWDDKFCDLLPCPLSHPQHSVTQHGGCAVGTQTHPLTVDTPFPAPPPPLGAPNLLSVPLDFLHFLPGRAGWGRGSFPQ